MASTVSINPASGMQINRPKPKWYLHALHAIYYLVMIAFLVFYMLPFWGTLTTSLKTNNEVMTSSPVALPTQFTAEGYISAFEELKVPLINSLVITIGGALGSLFLGSVCAYALSKWKFKFSNLFFVLLVAATYLPYQAILIPLLQTINALNLYDNVLGLILVHSVFGMPMCTVMMRGYYADVPDALIRQAMIDGNGPWSIYAKICLLYTSGNSRPGPCHGRAGCCRSASGSPRSFPPQRRGVRPRRCCGHWSLRSRRRSACPRPPRPRR